MVWGRVVLLAGIAGMVGFVLGGLVSAAMGLGWLAFGLPLGLLGGGLVALTARKGFDDAVAAHPPRGLRGPLTRAMTALGLGVGRSPDAR